MVHGARREDPVPVDPQGVERGEDRAKGPAHEESAVQRTPEESQGRERGPDDLEAEHGAKRLEPRVPIDERLRADAEERRGHPSSGEGVDRGPAAQVKERLGRHEERHRDEPVRDEVQDEPATQRGGYLGRGRHPRAVMRSRRRPPRPGLRWSRSGPGHGARPTHPLWRSTVSSACRTTPCPAAHGSKPRPWPGSRGPLRRRRGARRRT